VSSRLLILPALAAIAAAAACAPSDNVDSKSAVAPSGTGAIAACTAGQLRLKTPGKLTVGTDKPAYQPWFADDDPTNGRGFESAVVYALADALGFAARDVTWVTVGFNQSFAPGDKEFDFEVNQISITPERGKVVTFSDGYYAVAQGVVALDGGAYSNVTSVAGLRGARIAVQVGTTALRAVQEQIRPRDQPSVFNDQIDAIQALKNRQVDVIVLDLPTAFYATTAQIKGSKLVGQLPPVANADQFGLLLEKDNPLVTCLNKALGALKSSGQLQQIQDRWLAASAGAPVLQ